MSDQEEKTSGEQPSADENYEFDQTEEELIDALSKKDIP